MKATVMSVEKENPELSDADRRRKLVKRQLDSLINSNPQLYYEATAAVARAVHQDLQNNESLTEDESKALAGLSARDIEIILAYK